MHLNSTRSIATTQPTADTRLQSKHAASIKIAGILLRIVFLVVMIDGESTDVFIFYEDRRVCRRELIASKDVEAGKLILHVNIFS